MWESKEAGKARVYLAERGLSEEALREFHVGYAPSAWDRVLLASQRGGFTVDGEGPDPGGACIDGNERGHKLPQATHLRS